VRITIALVSAAAVAAALTACEPAASGTAPASSTTPAGTAQAAGPGSDGAVVSGSSFSRSGRGEAHYAECTSPAGEQFRVQVPADLEYQLEEGQPCPDGPREPMATDQHPEIHEELTKQLPYGGGDRTSCGEWQTVDKEEARRMAEQCPPLKWGDLE
jgi:hypothetical protein